MFFSYGKQKKFSKNESEKSPLLALTQSAPQKNTPLPPLRLTPAVPSVVPQSNPTPAPVATPSTSDLPAYLREARKFGMNNSEIVQELKSAGWPEGLIRRALGISGW